MSKYIVASSQNIAIAPVLQRSALSCRDRRWARDQTCVKRPQSLPLCHATAAGNPVAAQLQAWLPPSHPELPQSFGVLSSQARESKAKINEWDLIKLRGFCTREETVGKRKK